MPLSRAMSALLFLWVLPVSVAVGQVRRFVPSDLSCPKCRIEVRKIVTFGDADGPGAIASRPYSISRDSKGRYYVVTPDTYNEPPLVFDAEGRFVQRIGREGDGPGEYRMPSVILVSARDSVYILDQAGRLTVLSPSFELVTSTLLTFSPMSGVRMDDGSFVVNANIGDTDRLGIPLHHIDADGAVLASFGDDGSVLRPGELHSLLRWLAVGHGGGVWAVPFSNKYVIELWNPAGDRVAELVRQAEWFRPYDRYWLPSLKDRPAPRIMGVWEDGDGNVWTIVHVGDRRWKRGLAKGIPAEGQMMYPIEDEQRVYDTIVEVIDPSTGRVVASRRFDETFDVVVEPNLVAGYREADDGRPYVEIWQVHLRKP